MARVDKPKIGEVYHYIDLDDAWAHYTYQTKENVMDQMDRYYFATANWTRDRETLIDRTPEILARLTTLDEAAIADLVMRHLEDA